MSTIRPCSFSSEGDCHKSTYLPKNIVSNLKDVTTISSDIQKTLKLRLGDPNTDLQTICSHHEQVFLHRFTHLKAGILCCNPFNAHKKRQGTDVVSLEQAERYSNLSVIPGKKVCVVCRQKLNAEPTVASESSKTEEMSKSSEKHSQSSSEEFKEPTETGLNTSLQVLNETPVKKNLPVKRRKKQAIKKIQKVVTNIAGKLEGELGITIPPLTVSPSSSSAASPSPRDSSHDLQQYMESLKKKYSTTRSKEEKFQILTLVPTNWSVERTNQFFSASHRQIKKARKSRLEYGILSKPAAKKGRPIEDFIKQQVVAFYENDNITRQCAGAKEAVSIIHGKEKKQKRLILMSLKEAHEQFKEQYPGVSIGFSSFASLRPKWCVLPGASGTHSVCVCTYHQNFKLMLQALCIKLNYKDVISMTVCSINNELCMFGRCDNCPGSTALASFLDTIEELADLDTIEYLQWVSVDRTALETLVDTVESLKNKLLEKASSLTIHHFVAKAQNEYLRNLKTILPQDECIIILDYAENYHFVIQDAAQGYHWDNSQATIHPFVLYYKQNDVLAVKCYAVISDELNHNTIAVYCFQNEIIECLKSEIVGVDIKKIHYFSDGSPVQYKNKKNFLNICHHLQDFKVQCEWNFFATSHGKYACDGVIKREAAKSSLQKVGAASPIQTPKQLYQWAQSYAKGITVVWIPKEEVETVSKNLSKRFQNVKAVPGSRMVHKFVPRSESEIDAYEMSTSQIYTTHRTVILADAEPKLQSSDIKDQVSVGDFVSFTYDNQVYVGQVTNILENNEYPLLINAMEKSGTDYYRWPSKSDEIAYKWDQVQQKLEHPVPITSQRGAFKFPNYKK